MKILYDHQIFSTQKYGGISRYFYELMNEFNANEDIDYRLNLLVSNNYYISNLDDINPFEFFSDTGFKGKNRLISWLNQKQFNLTHSRGNYDVFHPTYYTPKFLDKIGNKPFVLTVHDMIHEKFSEQFAKNDYTSPNKKILVERASRIITVSQNTKDDLVDMWGVEADKIDVIYLGNSMKMPTDNTGALKTPAEYILFVGNRNGYKNFDGLTEAVAPLIKQNEELFIICAGGGNFKPSELDDFKKLGIEDNVLQYSLNDDSLAHLYMNAKMYVFPSKYEGFGIPVLEAYSCDCPLACSENSSLGEVAGNGAELFDPYEVSSIHNAVKSLLENEDRRNELVKNGQKRLEDFAWKDTALATKHTYRNVLSK